MLLPDPLVCTLGLNYNLSGREEVVILRMGYLVCFLAMTKVLTPIGGDWVFSAIVQSQPPPCTHRGRLVLQTAPLQRCHTLQKNSQRSGGGWLFSSKGAIA